MVDGIAATPISVRMRAVFLTTSRAIQAWNSVEARGAKPHTAPSVCAVHAPPLRLQTYRVEACLQRVALTRDIDIRGSQAFLLVRTAQLRAYS